MSKIGVTRGSIGDELKGTGISKGLPLCEKSALLNDISAKPTETKDAEVQTTWLDYLTSVTNFYGGRQMAFGSFSVIFLAILFFGILTPTTSALECTYVSIFITTFTYIYVIPLKL